MTEKHATTTLKIHKIVKWLPVCGGYHGMLLAQFGINGTSDVCQT